MAPLTATHSDSLTAASRQALATLSGLDFCRDFYLAGSAALALYLGHRRVRDLDFMSAGSRLRSAERRDHLEAILAVDGSTQVETARDGFLYVRLDSGVGVRFYYYPYPLVAPEETCLGVDVASAPDLGLMKLAAIVSRGRRKDFLDLEALCRRLPLDELLGRAADKFGHVRDFPLQALKALADHSHALPEPHVDEEAWSAAASWALAETVRLSRERFDLPQEPSR